MKVELNDKYDAIIEAAIRRFSHFGIQKTNMTEIAEDVAISKQALAYYFGDKQSLVKAVGEQIIEKYLQEVHAGFQSSPTIEAALIQLCDIKKAFFERYYMLYLQASSTDFKLGHPELVHFKEQVRLKELDIVATLLQNGMAKGEVAPMDVEKNSALIIDTLQAFECAVKVEKVFPDHKDFQEMIKKQKDMLHLLVNGLKQNEARA
jgi:TetR/AcrR family transcriptional regulator